MKYDNIVVMVVLFCFFPTLVVGEGQTYRKRSHLVVLDFKHERLPRSMVREMTEKLRRELRENGRFVVFNRDEQKEILHDGDIYASGCVDVDCAVEAGRYIGVKYVLMGEIWKSRSGITVRAHLVNTRTAEIVKTVESHCSGCSPRRIYKVTLPRIADDLHRFTKTKNSTFKKKYKGYGNLYVVVKPSSCRVYVDGEYYGKGTTMIRDLPAGIVTVTIKRGRYRQSKDVRILRRETKRVSMDLFSSSGSGFKHKKKYREDD